MGSEAVDDFAKLEAGRCWTDKNDYDSVGD